MRGTPQRQNSPSRTPNIARDEIEEVVNELHLEHLVGRNERQIIPRTCLFARHLARHILREQTIRTPRETIDERCTMLKRLDRFRFIERIAPFALTQQNRF